MVDFIVIAIIALIIGAAVAYIIKAKKSGKKCIGCPDGCSCGKNTKDTTEQSCGGSCSSCCSCGQDNNSK